MISACEYTPDSTMSIDSMTFVPIPPSGESMVIQRPVGSYAMNWEEESPATMEWNWSGISMYFESERWSLLGS